VNSVRYLQKASHHYYSPLVELSTSFSLVLSKVSDDGGDDKLTLKNKDLEILCPKQHFTNTSSYFSLKGLEFCFVSLKGKIYLSNKKAITLKPFFASNICK
jgi:hypothetical protein